MTGVKHTLGVQAAIVREAALEALLALYKDADNLMSMHEFTERFKHRFLELPNDIDDRVAVRGVQLVTLLVKANAMQASQTAHIYQLLLEESAGLREAAADLIASRISDIGRHHFVKILEKQTGRGRRKSVDSYSEAELQIGGLLTIIHLLRTDQVEAAKGVEEGLHSDADLVAEVGDPLFERVGVLQQWGELTKALLDDKACEARGEGATTHMVLLLQAAVQRAVGKLQLSSKGHKKQIGRNKAAATSVETHQKQLTMELSKTLLKLLRRFQGDSVKVSRPRPIPSLPSSSHWHSPLYNQLWQIHHHQYILRACFLATTA